jgi:glycosyltransferase involved in cell wall biosynthesis
MFISVCVGAVRGGSVGALIDSIRRQAYKDWELIVVAQGNDQQLLDEVSQRAIADNRIHLLHLQQFGRSRALNAAVKIAQGDILAFTDDDCEVAPDWMSTIDMCFHKEPDVGIVAGDLLPDRANGFSISTCPAAHTIEYVYRPSEIGFVAPHGFYWIGGNVAIKQDAMRKIGSFDEYLGVGTEFPSCEDVDFGLRAEELDVAMWTTPRLNVRHTYGRRYGIKSFLKHQKGYALGRGAFDAKLVMWEHRLSKVWGIPESRRNVLQNVMRSPRSMIDLYNQKYRIVGQQQCISKYELGPDRLLRPRLFGVSTSS